MTRLASSIWAIVQSPATRAEVTAIRHRVLSLGDNPPGARRCEARTLMRPHNL